jgi:predicted HTH transcriptional regulator
VPGLEIPGDDAPSEEALEQQITEAAENYCEEPPEVSVDFIDIEGKKVVIISVSAVNRPYILRSSPGEVRIRRGSQNKKATVREILTMQRDFISIDVGIQLSEEIITKSEKYYGNKDLMSILQEVLSNTLDRVRTSGREQHRYNYLMARLYWLANDTTDIPRCKRFVERALRDQDANPAYWFFKAEVCCRLAEEYIARHQQWKFSYKNETEEDQLQNHIPTELEDARKEIDEASNALETAHDFGGSMNDYIDLSAKLERLRISFALELESYSIENIADE